MLSEVSRAQKDTGCMFKIDPKDKHIYKNKHEHMQTRK
jgi:hypothetical protein